MLEIDGLRVRFDGVQALAGLTLTVPAGTRLGVIGPNGSGKTTLLNAISGLVAIASGTIRLDGQEISRLAPHEIARSGVARTFQAVRLFHRLSVLDNVLPDAGPRAAPAADARRAALEALEAVDLGGRRNAMAGDLSFFEQRRLEIARAIAQQPRLLLVDEPTSGLSRAEAEAIVAILTHRVDVATTVLMIEHNVNAIEALCPRAIVLVEGNLTADAPTKDLLHDQRLADVYFGSQSRADRG